MIIKSFLFITSVTTLNELCSRQPRTHTHTVTHTCLLHTHAHAHTYPHTRVQTSSLAVHFKYTSSQHRSVRHVSETPIVILHHPPCHPSPPRHSDRPQVVTVCHGSVWDQLLVGLEFGLLVYKAQTTRPSLHPISTLQRPPPFRTDTSCMPRFLFFPLKSFLSFFFSFNHWLSVQGRGGVGEGGREVGLLEERGGAF